jgi:hypothetical protein
MQALRADRKTFERTYSITRRGKEGNMAAFHRAASDQMWSQEKTAELLQQYQALLHRIESEQHRVDDAVAAGLQDLETLNTWLRGLGRPPMDTIAKARKALKRIYINIYDLVGENYAAEKKTLNELRKYTAKNQLYYPLQAAKTTTVKVFLQRLMPSKRP